MATAEHTFKGFDAASGKARGFDGFVEIFRAGTHTDSAGQSKTWTAADLDAMVANHQGEHSAPIVIGHPKTDSPAYGWASELKRKGSKLVAKFNQVQPAFASMVEQGLFPNRSIKVVSTANGPKLAHVGFLGAAPPAIEGLQPMQFEGEAAGAVYEFSADEAWGWSLIARSFRNLREFLIDKFDVATADQVAPQYQIDSLTQIAADVAEDAADGGADEAAESEPAPPAAAFSSAAPSATRRAASSSVENIVDKTFTQADLDAAVAAERTKTTVAEARVAEFAKRDRLASATALIKGHVDAGRLLPAQAAGLAEFRAQLDDAAEYEFAAADGAAVKRTPAAAFDALLASLPKQIELGGKGSGAATEVSSDPHAVAMRAQEFVAEEAKHGRTITIAEAVAKVSAQR